MYLTNQCERAGHIQHYILLGFAGVALFVGSFLILNTFSIIVAQRTRELALMRAIGGSKRQMIGSVLTEAARSEFPKVASEDFLDCADASGQALAALRVGLCRLILWPDAPGRTRVGAIVVRKGGVLLPNRPPALDLARPRAARWLQEWVRTAGRIDDTVPPLR